MVTATLARTMPPTGNHDDTRQETAGVDRATHPLKPDTPSPARLTLQVQLPADPVAPSVARDQLRRWLAELSWPPGQTQDIVLAVSEAVSNAAEHAYLGQPPGLVEVHGEVEPVAGGQRRVTIRVRDHGRWRPVPKDSENRRRGIPLMRACVDTVVIDQPHGEDGGTRVILRSRAVPPPS
jgi:anti-sigma regulatory factor (Ser/Thr protein kinase)